MKKMLYLIQFRLTAVHSEEQGAILQVLAVLVTIVAIVHNTVKVTFSLKNPFYKKQGVVSRMGAYVICTYFSGLQTHK